MFWLREVSYKAGCRIAGGGGDRGLFSSARECCYAQGNRPFAASLFTKSSGQQGDSDKKRAERRRRAMLQGPLSVRDKLTMTRAQDPWRQERQDRQREVREQYRSDRADLMRERRRADEKLQNQLARERQSVEAHYHLQRLKPGDPRWQQVKKMADERYGRIERQLQRQHHDAWKKQFRDLRTQRDRQYRQITKNMKRERRRSTGLPSKLLDPFSE